MSDPEGPVHYQISVTGRQAAAFFLALLSALGLSFFFGMRTGLASHRAPDPATRLAAVSDLPAAAQAPETAPEDVKAKKGPSPTPEAVEKKLGFEDASPKEVAAPSPAPKAEASKAPEPTAVGPRPAPKPEAAKPAAKADKKEAPRKEPGRKEPGKKEGPFYVQLLATKEAEVADQMAKKVKGAGGFASPDVSTVPSKPGVFRVRIGPYADRSLAEAAVRRLKAEKWKLEPAIVRADKP